MKTTTKPQLSAIHSLFAESGITEKKDKSPIISEYTNGRTTSSREMTYQEAKALISHLSSAKKDDNSSDKMRKKILSMAHEMNWRKDGKIDMVRVNAWCVNYGYLHKRLDEYKYSELPKLITQFQTAYKQHIEKV